MPPKLTHAHIPKVHSQTLKDNEYEKDLKRAHMMSDGQPK